MILQLLQNHQMTGTKDQNSIFSQTTIVSSKLICNHTIHSGHTLRKS